jgi:hypothetical protein
MKVRYSVGIVGVIVCAAVGYAAFEPVLNINPSRHPNLAAAQTFSRDAWEKLVMAQRANDWDLDGHAQKAKDLLEQVNIEIKAAAEAANRNSHR